MLMLPMGGTERLSRGFASEITVSYRLREDPEQRREPVPDLSGCAVRFGQGLPEYPAQGGLL